MSLNPIDSPGAYIDIRVGGRSFPGPIVKGGIRGLKNTHEWSTVRPIAGTGWTQMDKGRPPIKGIEVEIALDAPSDARRAAAWEAHYKFVVFIRGKKPPLISKPPALAVTGAPFKDAGVLAVVYAGHDTPIFDTGRLFVVYRFDEATKSTIIPIGPPEAAILDETNPQPKTIQEGLLVANAEATTGIAVPFDVMAARYPGIGAVGQ